MAESTIATSISLSWATGGSEGIRYTVFWQRDTSGDCSDEDQGSDTITDGSTSYDIVSLEEDSSYSIAVTASNVIGNETSEPITEMTLTAGESIDFHCNYQQYWYLLLSSICSSLFCESD